MRKKKIIQLLSIGCMAASATITAVKTYKRIKEIRAEHSLTNKDKYTDENSDNESDDWIDNFDKEIDKDFDSYSRYTLDDLLGKQEGSQSLPSIVKTSLASGQHMIIGGPASSGRSLIAQTVEAELDIKYSEMDNCDVKQVLQHIKDDIPVSICLGLDVEHVVNSYFTKLCTVYNKEDALNELEKIKRILILDSIEIPNGFKRGVREYWTLHRKAGTNTFLARQLYNYDLYSQKVCPIHGFSFEVNTISENEAENLTEVENEDI